MACFFGCEVDTGGDLHTRHFGRGEKRVCRACDEKAQRKSGASVNLLRKSIYNYSLCDNNS